MDKVIIDGIDVSECKNFIPVYTEDTDIEINNCCTLTYTPCQFEKKDCYYKQLKRLEQENETLERTNNELRKRFSEDTTKLSAELKELKADIESRTMCITCERELQNCNLQAENERLKLSERDLSRICQAFKKDIEAEKSCKLKYYKTLQKIRDIILSPEIIDEETKKLHTSEELDNIVRWHREDKLSKIQAKINEVIGAE